MNIQQRAMAEARAKRHRPIVDTWDVFDTLVARFGIEPSYIFTIVEQVAGHPGFPAQRMAAQSHLDSLRRPYTIYDIYRVFAEQQALDPARVRQLLQAELTVEREQMLPITRQVARVGRDDLLISDMYLAPDHVSDILRGVCGLNSIRPPVVGNWGKMTGTVWRTLRAHYLIRRHHGDNRQSDIEGPKRLGIPVEYIGDHVPTAWEQGVMAAGFPKLALMIRELRLRRMPQGASPFHQTVLGPYCTFLLAFALYLRAFAQAHDIRHYVFASRDTDQVSYLFRQLPDCIEAESLDLNRALLLSGEADGHFLSRLRAESTIVDLISSGRSLAQFSARTGKTWPMIVGMMFDRHMSAGARAERQAQQDQGTLHVMSLATEFPHHYHLEVLFEAGYAAVVGLDLDGGSGALVRRHAPGDHSPAEQDRHDFVNASVGELGVILRRRGDDPGHGLADLHKLVHMAMRECLAAKTLDYFESFSLREAEF